jgi:hypothetical protein
MWGLFRLMYKEGKCVCMYIYVCAHSMQPSQPICFSLCIYINKYSPLSLSTRKTETTSSLFTRINFLMDRMRRRESSEWRIMPCWG